MSTRTVLSAVALLAAVFFLMFRSASRPEVVVYTSLDPVFSRTILAEFEKETGIRARAVFDTEATKTTGLIERVRRERERPQCDVLWSNEPLRTIRLAKEGLFTPYRSPAAEGIPARFRDASGLWTGFAARARVIAFDPQKLSADRVPRTLDAIFDESFRDQIALADPRFGTTGSHLAAWLAAWGEERYRAFLERLRDHGVQIVGGNSMSRDRVLSGEVLLGFTDTDDVEVARRAGDSIDETFLADQGTLVLPNTVAIVANSPNPEAAQALVDFLLARAREEALAAAPSRQIPVRDDVPVPPTGLRLSDVREGVYDLEAAAEALPRALDIAGEIFRR